MLVKYYQKFGAFMRKNIFDNNFFKTTRRFIFSCFMSATFYSQYISSDFNLINYFKKVNSLDCRIYLPSSIVQDTILLKSIFERKFLIKYSLVNSFIFCEYVLITQTFLKK